MKKSNIQIFVKNTKLSTVLNEILESINTNSSFKFEISNQKNIFHSDLHYTIMDDSYLFSNLEIVDHCKKIFLISTNEKNEKLQNNNVEIIKFSIPFKINDLLTRILSDIKQQEIQSDRKYKFNLFTYDPGMRILSNKENSLRFTEKEGQIFQCLLEHGHDYLSRKQLLEIVWRYTEKIDTHTLETHIYALRKKISKNFLLKDLIIFEEKKGYLLNKNVL